MEHMARLAVLEHYFCFSPAYEEFLRITLQCIERFAQKSDENEQKIIVKDIDGLSGLLQVEGALEYLNYIGIFLSRGELKFSKEKDIRSLSEAKSAIEAKLKLCAEPESTGAIRKQPPRETFDTDLGMNFTNPFLNFVERNCHRVGVYEDPQSQHRARQYVPLVTLQFKAMKYIREQQKRIKYGSGKSETSFEMALLRELVVWFKQSFFSWHEPPTCRCGKRTRCTGYRNGWVQGEYCYVEKYSCEDDCYAYEFVRFNNPLTLLHTRVGRCGEWANCFAFICRSLGFETRYVADTTDHVWCEIYDIQEQRWVHVDPCEAAIDTPLMYEHGWNKQIEYVMAYSHDDVQDVTWRYSSNFAQVRERRKRVSEAELIEGLNRLRTCLQAGLSDARRKYLQMRTLRELAEMLVEKKPAENEDTGRTSGSLEWRLQRGEYRQNRHTFMFNRNGRYRLCYSSVEDKYAIQEITRNPSLRFPIKITDIEWREGTWSYSNMQRFVELDWGMSYLSRIDGGKCGHISWRVAVTDGLRIESISVYDSGALFENGAIDWSICCDDSDNYDHVYFAGSKELKYTCNSHSVTLQATLSHGVGPVSWQHAQLFRQSTHNILNAKAFKILCGVNVTPVE